MTVDLRPIEAGDFPKVYSIMEESFPSCEKRPYNEAKGLIKNPDYKILLVTAHKKIVGFLSIWTFRTFNFIELFAIRRSMRGLGFGSSALKQYLKKTTKPCVLEVESFETKNAKRRIRFYNRLGFIMNDIAYLQPMRPGENSCVPLKIMSYPRHIGEQSRKRVKKIIFDRVYGVSI